MYISDLRAWLNIDFEGDSSDPPSCAANPIHRGLLYLNGRQITHLIIPESVSTIKDYTFGGCDGFSCIEIPSSVTSIGQDSFGGCDGVTYLKIPDSVTFIGNYAFGWCHTLKDLIIGNSVTNIMKCAFAYSNSLENIVIPNSITSIGTEIFRGCNKISTITIYGEGGWQGAAINHTTKTLYIDSQITSLNGIKINPTNDVYSFSTIPPVCDANSFTNFNGTLHVPASSLASYFTAEYWSNFANIVGDAIEPTEVAISENRVEMQLGGEQYRLSAEIFPTTATPNNVIWISTDPSIATVNNGMVEAVSAGECDIIAQCLNKQAICHVVVNDTTVTITLDQQEAMVLPNHIITITPSASPVVPALAVTSSDPSVAAARVVNNKIQVVGIKEGTSTITVGSVDGTAIPATCLVTVYTELGDVNCDGFVNIADVTSLIDCLLGGDSGSYSAENADTNDDGSVNIADVTMLIDYLLGGIDLNPPMTETFTVNGVTFKMVAVEGGSFTMGATAELVSEAYDPEMPAHQVTLSSYCIGETEVTQALWLAVMGSNPSQFTPANGYAENLQRPVESVSWNNCQTFITRLNELTRKNFRLPTEAEWEYAARGGNNSKGYKYAGSNTIDDVAWYRENSCTVGSGSQDYGTHAVATKAPNELGLYDMTGNVLEWCQDWYGDYSSEAQMNPSGPSSGSFRVYRSGCWSGTAQGCRVSYRYGNDPTVTSQIQGLRLAL